MVKYDRLPIRMVCATRRYIEEGILPGDFLQQVFSNSLVGAYMEADNGNRACMFEWAKFLYWEAPPGCHGSKEKMVAWCACQGLRDEPWPEEVKSDG